MPQLRSDTPQYDRAVYDFVNSVIDGILALDPIYANIPKRSTQHAGPTRNVVDQQLIDRPPAVSEHIFQVHFDVIRHSDVSKYVAAIYDLAKALEDRMQRELFETLSVITEATGNVVRGGGQPFSHDRFLDAIELLDISFDEEGRPTMPVVAMGPELYRTVQATEVTEEQLQRFREILLRKKREHDAQKRTRRLPR